jgi:hypothetical protein
MAAEGFWLTGADRFMLEVAAGLMVQHRAGTIENAARSLLISTLAKLGFGPSERSKTKAPGGKDDDLRGRDAAIDAICAYQERRAAERADAAPGAGSASPPANAAANALRAHLAELGLVGEKGREGLHQLAAVVTECGNERPPSDARFACHHVSAPKTIA